MVANAILECDDETKADLRKLANILTDSTSSDDEKKYAAHTFMFLLFPKKSLELGDKENFADLKDADSVQRKMKEQQTSFSIKLGLIMKEKGVTQVELAERIGVGQSAIANMLARECRPQKRTILKIAEALHVKPDELWAVESDYIP